MEADLRIAISGTYSTGKTTTTEALSVLTGIPRTHARTMREILPDAVPGKTLEECRPAEIIQLGIWRLKERAVNEQLCGDTYFSDGSSLHEWVYGTARMKVGINPNLGPVAQRLAQAQGMFSRRFYGEMLSNFGNVAKKHAKGAYDVFVHLPVEFPLVDDGHRPVSERFRTISSDLIMRTLDELEIDYHIVGGTLEERLRKIVQIFSLPVVTDYAQAITESQRRVAIAAREAKAALEQSGKRSALRRTTQLAGEPGR